MPAKRKAKKTKEPELKAPIFTGREISYYLTGESLLKGSVTPFPPTSKEPATVRFTHSNSYGPVDAEIFVRMSEPKPPLGFEEFLKEQEKELSVESTGWLKAKTVADEIWDDENEKWIPRPKKTTAGETMWQGTYEAQLQFPPGKHVIEIKFISPIEHVCSAVFSNWEFNVK
jgi:hypothetical protein